MLAINEMRRTVERKEEEDKEIIKIVNRCENQTLKD